MLAYLTQPKSVPDFLEGGGNVWFTRDKFLTAKIAHMHNAKMDVTKRLIELKSSTLAKKRLCPCEAWHSFFQAGTPYVCSLVCLFWLQIRFHSASADLTMHRLTANQKTSALCLPTRLSTSPHVLRALTPLWSLVLANLHHVLSASNASVLWRTGQ
jgi:hypothetical protein